MSPFETSDSKRKFARRPLTFEAIIRRDNETMPCSILNISSGGAKAKLDATIDKNTPVILDLAPFGSFPCRVAWQRGTTLGLKFQTDPLEMAEVVLAMAVYS